LAVRRGNIPRSIPVWPARIRRDRVGKASEVAFVKRDIWRTQVRHTVREAGLPRRVCFLEDYGGLRKMGSPRLPNANYNRVYI